jgi:hypothetical protein
MWSATFENDLNAIDVRDVLFPLLKNQKSTPSSPHGRRWLLAPFSVFSYSTHHILFSKNLSGAHDFSSPSVSSFENQAIILGMCFASFKKDEDNQDMCEISPPAIWMSTARIGQI